MLRLQNGSFSLARARAVCGFQWMCFCVLGRFDAPDRLFHSMQTSWTSCLTNPADVKVVPVERSTHTRRHTYIHIRAHAPLREGIHSCFSPSRSWFQSSSIQNWLEPSFLTADSCRWGRQQRERRSEMHVEHLSLSLFLLPADHLPRVLDILFCS